MPGIYENYANAVSNIMMANASAQAEAARQRGQIWGQSLNALGQQISNLPTQYAQLQNMQAQQQMNQLNLQMAKANMAGMQQGNAIIQKHTVNGVVNRDGLSGDMASANIPLPVQKELLSNLDDMEASAQKHQQNTKNHYADLANGAIRQIDAGIDPRIAVGSTLGIATNNNTVPDPVATNLQNQLAQVDPTKWRGFLDSIRAQGSQYAELYKPQVGRENATVISGNAPPGQQVSGGVAGPFTPKNETELAADAATLGTDKETPTASNSQTALKILKDQKAGGDTAAAADERMRQILQKQSLKQPISPEDQAWANAYRQVKTLVPTATANLRVSTENDKLVKVEHKDPTTGQTVVEWLPESQVRGKTFEAPTPAGVATRVASAQTVKQTGEDLISKLSDPKFAQTVGPTLGRYSSLQDFIGNPPPEYAELAGEIESYALANMGVHGMRSAQGAAQIKQMLSAKHTPQSLIAAIKGLNSFSDNFIKNQGVNAPAPTAAPSKNPFR